MLRYFWVVLLMVVATQSSAAPRSPAGSNSSGIVARGRPDEFGGYASTHIIVRSKAPPPGAAQTRSGGMLAANSRLRIRNFRPAYAQHFSNPEKAAQLGLDRTYIVEVPPDTDAVALAAAYAALPEIERAEVDAIGGVAGLIPNDPNFGLQWGLHNVGQVTGTPDADIDAPESWDIHSSGGAPVTIAIVDSGVDLHPDLIDRLIPGRNTNDPANPNLTTTLPPPGSAPGTPQCRHGTHVAGIAAATGNNGIGISGVIWDASIMPIRVVDGSCIGSETQCAEGIIWAVDHGADIINMSLQFYGGTSVLRDAVEYAWAQGAVVVAAAGNDRENVVAFPARFEDAIAVTATTADDCRYFRSNYGAEVDLSAPGAFIYSTYSSSSVTNPYTYTYLSGTSMAAPHVSGLAALLKSNKPTLSNADVRFILENTADDIVFPECDGVPYPGWDEHTGLGRINAYRAMLAASENVGIISSEPPDGSIDARQPFALSGAQIAGIRSLALTFDDNPIAVGPEDFLVTKLGGTTPAPSVIGVSVVAETEISIVLERQLEPVSWTTFTHIESSTSVSLGYLPGDVNGDGTTDILDVHSYTQALDGGGETLPPYSFDINRLGAASATPLGLMRVMDLLNGADAYPPYLGVSLP